MTSNYLPSVNNWSREGPFIWLKAGQDGGTTNLLTGVGIASISVDDVEVTGGGDVLNVGIGVAGISTDGVRTTRGGDILEGRCNDRRSAPKAERWEIHRLDFSECVEMLYK